MGRDTNLDKQDISDLYEVYRMMNSHAWDVLMVSIAADREKLVRIVSGAQTKGEARKHDWEYFQGSLAGFQRVIDIFDNFREQYERIKEADDAEVSER